MKAVAPRVTQRLRLDCLGLPAGTEGAGLRRCVSTSGFIVIGGGVSKASTFDHPAMPAVQ